MDTKKLAALAAAVRLGSFTRAAEELGYTQSGLTHMMNSLEKDVGFPVLVRSRSGVRLTPAGRPRAGRGLPSPQGAASHGPAVHGRSAGNDRDNVTFVRILCWNFRN